MFDLIRSWRYDRTAVLCAFDLLELDGQDLRRLLIEVRKARLARLLPKPLEGIALNEYFAGDGAHYLRACLQARLRRDTVEATLSLRPLQAVSEGQEPDGIGGAARG